MALVEASWFAFDLKKSDIKVAWARKWVGIG